MAFGAWARTLSSDASGIALSPSISTPISLIPRCAMGARTFLAHVQAQNGPLFRQMHWETFGELDLLGRPHLKMRADLAKYPPCHAPELGFVALRKAA